jgi:cytosolic phospholipase A2
MDLGQVKKQLQFDNEDRLTYPELGWDATVRSSSALHAREEKFIESRKRIISCSAAQPLHTFLGLPADEQVSKEHVPLIAIGGSGGGYRAMYGFAGFISAAKRLGLWDCTMWVAGVSGSCWSIAGYYTIARQSASRLICHYLAVAREVVHPLSLAGLNVVARSGKGVYFIIGPLLRKARTGIIGLRVMDLYGTLISSYQFLSRTPGARLSRSAFQWSKTFERSGIDQGLEPLPLLTAVRKAPKGSNGVKPHADSSLSMGRPPKRALRQHQSSVTNNPSTGLNGTTSNDRPFAKGFFQWFEFSPLESGSESCGFVPTWSWGRTFISGRSHGRQPEQSLALLLGQCTSAPAGPLTGYISALLASMPHGTAMSKLLLLLNNLLQKQHWARFWGNPIRAGHDPNPFYGNAPEATFQPDRANLDNKLVRPKAREIQSSERITETETSEEAFTAAPPTSMLQTSTERNQGWELEGKVRMMDSGMSNNLPNHVLARPQRRADIIVAFDASSDVQTRSAVQRLQHFGEDCHIELEDQTALFSRPTPRLGPVVDESEFALARLESRFLHQYVQVFCGKRENGQQLYIIYCPLLPNSIKPELNPSVGFDNLLYPRLACHVQCLLFLDIDSIILNLIQPGVDANAGPGYCDHFSGELRKPRYPGHQRGCQKGLPKKQGK